MWQFYALLSAIFAAGVAVLSKVGIQGIDSNLAIAIRTAVVLIMAWSIVLFRSNIGEMATMSSRNWIFLILSGIATGLSWICYFKALHYGEASKVAPIDKLSVAFTIVLSLLFLGEPANPKVLIGGGLIVLGSLVILRA